MFGGVASNTRNKQDMDHEKLPGAYNLLPREGGSGVSVGCAGCEPG